MRVSASPGQRVTLGQLEIQPGTSKQGEAEPPKIHIVMNWAEELRSRQ